MKCPQCFTLLLTEDKHEHFKNCIKCIEYGNKRRNKHVSKLVEEYNNLISDNPKCGCEIIYEENRNIIKDYVVNSDNIIINLNDNILGNLHYTKLTIFIDHPNLYGYLKNNYFDFIYNLQLEHNIRLYMKTLHKKKFMKLINENSNKKLINMKFIVVTSDVAPESLDDKIMIMEMMSGNFLNTCLIYNNELDMYRDIGFYCMHCDASKRRYGKSNIITYIEHDNNYNKIYKYCNVNNTIIKCSNYVKYKIII